MKHHSTPIKGISLAFLALALCLLFATTALAQAEKVVIYLFWGDGCPHCEAAKPALRAMAQRYDVELREYEVWYNAENQAALNAMAAKFDFESRYVPTIFVADRYWEGYSEEIESEIDAVVAACLKTACPDAAAGIKLPASIQEPIEATDDDGEDVELLDVQPAAGQVQSDGFVLAILVMLGMLAALVYAFIYMQSGMVAQRNLRRRKLRRPAVAASGGWQHLGILALSLVGLGVAGYLAYVETQAVPAVCGPVGDCNAVQSSPYARLFGLLPVGVLGVFGYLAILAAWLYPQLRRDRYSGYMPIAVFALALFGVLFSLYLTFLEPFVIQAVCMWCITSAIIMTLLLLLSLKPALQAMQTLKK